MSESKQNSVFILDFVDELGDVFFGSDSLKHPDHSFVGSSVFGTIKSSSCHSDSSVDVDSRAGDMSDEGSRAVHLVFSMQDEEHLKSSGKFRVWLEGMLIESVHHEEEVLNVTQRFVGNIVFSSDSVTI